MIKVLLAAPENEGGRSMDTISYLSLPVLLLFYVYYRLNRLLKAGKNRKDADDKFGSVVWYGRTGICIGAAIGGMCGVILPPVYYQLTNPEILNDGQWGLVYLMALPVGIIVGAIIGCIVGMMFVSRK